MLGPPHTRDLVVTATRAGYHGHPRETTRELGRATLLDRLPGTCSKLGMKLLRDIVGWVWSRAGAIWRAVAPHAGPGVESGTAGDIVRGRRELVLENAMLRHQVVILRRKSPHPRFTTFDRLRLLVAAAVVLRRTGSLTIGGSGNRHNENSLVGFKENVFRAAFQMPTPVASQND